LPDSDEGEELIDRLGAEGIEVRAVHCGAKLPEKQRFLAGTQKLMKLDLFDPYLPDAAFQREFIALARETAAATHTDATIITDFGLGLFSAPMMGELCDELRGTTDVLAGDVSGRKSNLKSMRGMDLISPSEAEARDAVGLQSEGLPSVTWRLLDETRSRAAIITLGAEGLIAFDRLPDSARDLDEWKSRLSGDHIPALCPIALDPLGCGDSLLAGAALGLTCGGSLLQAAYIGAAAAAVQAGRLGNNAVSLHDVRREMTRVQHAHLSYEGSDVSIHVRSDAIKSALS